MKYSKLLAITMAAALGVGGWLGWLGSNVHAAEAPPGQPARGRWLERVKEKLDLTDEQVARIKAELGAERETLKTLLQRLHDARVGVREAIRAPHATETTVRAAAAKVGTAQADLAVERFKLFGRINPILTEEQREKVKEFEGRIDQWIDSAVDRLGAHLGTE